MSVLGLGSPLNLPDIHLGSESLVVTNIVTIDGLGFESQLTLNPVPNPSLQRVTRCYQHCYNRRARF